MMFCLGFLGVVLVAGVIYFLLGPMKKSRIYDLDEPDDDTQPDQAMETLRQRYAEGEISTEEYEERLEALEEERERTDLY
jgi:uncharacterized membrane protein